MARTASRLSRSRLPGGLFGRRVGPDTPPAPGWIRGSAGRVSAGTVGLWVATALEHATGGPILALLGATLSALVGAAAVLVAPDPAPMLLGAAAASVAIALGLLAPRSRLSPLVTIATIAALTAFSTVTYGLTPTVVWLYAFVVPAIGVVRGGGEGALAGLLAAPALHWIETGIPFDLRDPQTPFAIIILVALGAVPGQILAVARARGAALGVELSRTAALLEETERAHAAEREARQAAIFMLACAAEARDGTTGAHVYAVRDLAADLAAGTGLDRRQVDEIAWASMLHDIGKLRVPDRVLLKPDRLTEEEWAIIRQHPLWGEELLRGFEGFALAREIARWHHENWDGSGYPDRLAGEAIPLAARIVRVVDVFDALRSERPYKPAWPLDRIEAELRAMRGRALDPELTDLFLGRTFLRFG